MEDLNSANPSLKERNKKHSFLVSSDLCYDETDIFTLSLCRD